MPFRHVAGTFSDADLRVMQDAYDWVCAEIGLTLVPEMSASDRCSLRIVSVASDPHGGKFT
jgi:hypothetical protein